MTFRDRLIATIRAARPVLESPGVLVVGSEVRTGEKGERDLLVALGVLATSLPGDLDELLSLYRRLRPELRHAVRSNLTILSVLAPRSGMPDPQPRRAEVTALLRRLEAGDPEIA